MRIRRSCYSTKPKPKPTAQPPSPPKKSRPDQPGIDIPAHQRKARRGRKPLAPNLPREVIRHELPEAERVCPHDGSTLREIGVEASEQPDIIPQQVRVIRHERLNDAPEGTLLIHRLFVPSQGQEEMIRSLAKRIRSRD